MRFRRMPVDYNDCDYLPPCNKMKYNHILGNIWKSQVQYICIKVMLLARNLDAQYQQYNENIHKIFMKVTCIVADLI